MGDHTKMAHRTYRVIFTISIISLYVLDSNLVTSLNYECLTTNQQAGIGMANCSSQQLAHVPPNLAHNIQILDLSNNYITELGNSSFFKYEYLEILHLHNNSLSQIASMAFNRLRNLLYLDMSFNNLEVIPSQSFLGLKALLTLSLRGNRITSIPAGVFTSVNKLTNVYLSGNHIREIHPDAFKGLRNLQQLDLQNNALSHLNQTVTKHFTTNLKEIKLYHNPWFCDCNLRWLIQWLRNSSNLEVQRLRWSLPDGEPVCQGPSIVLNRPFSMLTGESFICPISMYSKARDVETIKGAEVELYCKYMADPYVEIQWRKNGKLIDLKRTDKYKVEYEGLHMINSKLHVYNFQYKDIGEYECFTENRLGEAYDSCLVTLEGVDPAEVIQPTIEDPDDSDRVRNAIIATATIGCVVLLLAIIIIVFCCIRRCKQYRRKKKESIRMSFEEHLKANGIIEPNPKHEPIIYDEVPEENSLDGELDEPDSVYNSLQRPRIPSSTNTNTYISFKSELSDHEDMTQMYSQGQQTNSASASNSKGSDGSQCESTSPLLENISPILIDPHDPFYAENLYVPRLYASTNNYLNSPHSPDFDEDLYIQRRIDSDFIPYRDIHGFILPSRPNGHGPHRASTLPYHSHQPYREPVLTPDEEMYIPHKTRTLPHGYTPHYASDYGSTPVVRSNSVSANHKSASVGHLGMCPPKKPPRSFHSRDTVSLYSQHSAGERDTELKLSLPKPGTVDKYGTAV